MYWCTAILVVVALAMPFSYGEEATSCDTNEIFGEMEGIRKFIQEWRSLKEPNSHELLKVMEKFEHMMKDTEGVKSEECKKEREQHIANLIMFPMALLGDDFEAAEAFLSLIEDDKALEHILSLLCSFDCNYVLEFTHKAKGPDTKIRMYNTLNNVLKYTDLNNTYIDTCVPFITHLHKHVAEETDATVLPVLKNLLHQAIKTDLVLQHHNSEALYGIDKELTSQVVNELINEQLAVPLKSDEAVVGFTLLEILKCPDNLSLWLEHLELVFNKLKENNKLKSMNSAILLKYVHLLKEKAQEEDKQKLENLEKELPAVVHKVLEGEMCMQFEENKKIKAFISNSGDSVKKFVPKEGGSVTYVNMHVLEDDYVMLLEKTDDLEGFFDFPIDVEQGELEPLAPEEYCNVVANICIAHRDLLPQMNLTSQHVGLFKKFVKFYIAQVQADCTNEA